MNDARYHICNKICFIDNHAYVAGGESKEKAEKFSYKDNKWIALPNYPIKSDLYGWSSALAFIPQEIKEETKILLKVTAPQDVIENF